MPKKGKKCLSWTEVKQLQEWKKKFLAAKTKQTRTKYRTLAKKLMSKRLCGF